jgi:Ca2+-binding RTX toxin-like protein
MTVFTAFQPVTLTASGVAGIFGFVKGGAHPVGLPNSHELEVENSSHTVVIDFKGFGFSYDFISQSITGGTLTSMEIFIGGPPAPIAYSFTHMSVDIARLVKDFGGTHGTGPTNYGDALNLFFPGHDVIKGSAGNDYLPDHNGHDRITGGLGSDTMFGSHGNDTFVFHVGSGTDHDIIKGFIASGPNHDNIQLFSDTGITKSTLHANEMYDHNSHVVVLTDTMGDTITVKGIHNLAAFNADVHFHA